MKYETLIESIIENIPELKESAENKKQCWYQGEDEYPLVYIFLGDVLNPFLVELLNNMDNEKLIDRIFEFFETMAQSEDINIREALTAGTLEVLGDDKERLRKARAFMRLNALLLSHEIEMSWGRE